MDYVSNSHKSKEEQAEVVEKKVEKVVKGTVKKNNVRRLADIFLPGDVEDVKSYIINEVVIPTIKDTIANTVEMLLFGGDGKRHSKSSTSSRTSYTKYYEKDKERESSKRGLKSGYLFEYEDIIVGSKGEAEKVFEQMEELIDKFDVVTVFDLYDMVDITPPYTSSRYGWDNIRGAEAIRLRNGEYVLKLPKFKEL